ncbi:MAG: hypothetical protein PHV34_12775 [Verrucomicrobiae bacterium]|nr:hypothetical protein [Verrucomicrobiae bacterium]
MSWLVEEIKQAFKGLITFQNKFEFYGRLALAANRWLEFHPDTDLRPLLLTVLAEGIQILSEMGAGTFQYLLVTENHTLAIELPHHGACPH